MAVRYVKDFEFPAASGYTKSATPVTGQMLAKGGPAKGGPKGVMVVIGVGKPMKKAEGGDVKTPEQREAELNDQRRGTRVYLGKDKDKKARGGKVKKAEGGDVKTPEQREAELNDQRRGTRVILGKDKDKKARGGKVMRANGGGVSDADRLNQMFADAAATTDAERTMSGKSKAPMAKKAVPVAKRGSPYVPNTNIRADEIYSKEAMDRLTRGYKKGGSAKHEDAAMDKALIKKMVRPDAMAGKVMKKAAGGAAIPPQMPLQGPPLQSMPAAVRAPAMGRARAPMVLGEPDAPRIAVNAKRPGGPNVGRLRARMAKAASMANPDSAPAMMKKGGKTNC